MKTWIILACIVLGIGYFWFNNSSSDAQETLKNLQSEHATIKVYSVDGNPITYRALETLKIYGFNSEFVSVKQLSDLAQVLPADALKKEITLPVFVLPNDEVISSEDFFASIQTLTPIDLTADKSKPYVIVYGIPNCVYTARARTELDNVGIPYEYINMNSDAARYMGIVEARMRASGYDGNSYNTPIIDVNGYMRPRMDASTVTSKYKE